MLAASLVVAAIDAGALGSKSGFEVVKFEVVGFDVARFVVLRFDAVRLGVGDETLLVAMLLAVLLVRLLATANPVSGALADFVLPQCLHRWWHPMKGLGAGRCRE